MDIAWTSILMCSHVWRDGLSVSWAEMCVHCNINWTVFSN